MRSVIVNKLGCSLLFILVAMHFSAYFFPQELTEFFPENKLVQAVSIYGITPLILSAISLISVFITKMKTPKTMYMLAGACTLFALVYSLRELSTISFFAVSMFLQDQVKDV